MIIVIGGFLLQSITETLYSGNHLNGECIYLNLPGKKNGIAP